MKPRIRDAAAEQPTQHASDRKLSAVLEGVDQGVDRWRVCAERKRPFAGPEIGGGEEL
jgi:hypothetical protein